MPTHVQAPDGSIAEFPDGMADSDIEAVMQREFPPGQAQSAASPSAVQPHQVELSAREPNFSERMADWTGMSPQYWANVAYKMKAPGRFLAGAEAPYQGLEQGLLHGGSYLASAGGYAPNMASRGLGSAAQAMDATLAKDEEQRQAERAQAGLDPRTTDYARLAGEVASPLYATTAGLTAAPEGANVLSRLLRSSVAGGLIGGEQPVYGGDYSGTKALQMMTGAKTGGAMELGAGVIGPWARDQAQHLMDRYDIRVPSGTAVGPFAGRIEQYGLRVPLSGQAVRGTYDRANEDLVRAGYNEALAPIQAHGFGPAEPYNPESAMQPGREMNAEAHQAVQDSYNAAIPRVQSTLDLPFNQAVAAERAALPARMRENFDDAMQRHIYNNAETLMPGVEPTAPPRFRGANQATPAGYNIQLDIGRGQQPGQMTATGQLTRPPAPPRQSAPTDPARAQLHANNLDQAGADPDIFERAFNTMIGDTGVRRGELAQTYQAYTGQAPGTMTIDALRNGIRQEFEARQIRAPFQLNGQNAKNADMGLRDEAQAFIQNPGTDPAQRQIGFALANVRNHLRDAWERHSPPDAIQHLNDTDLAYRRLMILDRASTSSAAPRGVFGPTQLWGAVKAGDPTLGKRGMAQGDAELQDLADTAKNVLGRTVPDSGTPEASAALLMAREGLLGGGLLGGSAATGTLLPLLGGMAGHAAAYSAPGQAMLRALVAGAPETRTGLAGMLRSAIPGGAALQTQDNRPRSVAEWRAMGGQR